SLRRLWPVAMSCHSARQGARPRRWNRVMPRRNLVRANTVSMMLALAVERCAVPGVEDRKPSPAGFSSAGENREELLRRGVLVRAEDGGALAIELEHPVVHADR